MLEVVFSDSAAGSLSLAMGKGSHPGGAVGVVVTHSDGSKPTQEELTAAQQEAEAQMRRSWSGAIPLGGSRKDILGFPLVLSVGDINEQGIGPKREAAVALLMGTYPGIAKEVTKELLEKSRKSLSTLLERANNGEPVRIWTSHHPDEACGLYWLMEQMRPIGFGKLDITFVKLPDFEEKPNGAVVQYTGWDEIAPHQWGKLAMSGKKLPGNLARAMAEHWKTLQAENAPLRAVLNGQLVSVPETLYDAYIRHELDAEKDEFAEAQVVGKVLGKYRLGIGDAWAALRIEQLIQDGILEPVTQPAQDEPIYHRLLRKCSENRES